MKRLIISGLLLLFSASYAQADPWKDESGKGQFCRGDGYHSEQYREGEKKYYEKERERAKKAWEKRR